MASDDPTEEEVEDEVDFEDVDPEDDAIEDLEDGEPFSDDDDENFDDDDADDEPASLEEVAEAEESEADDDEVEADLTAILQERIAADDDEEKPESKGRVETEEGEQLVSKKDDEVLCSSCFTLVSQKAIDEEQACPNCGADI